LSAINEELHDEVFGSYLCQDVADQKSLKSDQKVFKPF